MSKNTEWVGGIKGLTAKDRQKWEQDLLKRDSASYDQYNKMSEQEKIEAYLNENFYDKFSGREDYESLRGLNFDDTKKFWNANYDLEENNVTKYSVESTNSRGNLFDSQKSFSDNPNTSTKSMLDIFGNELTNDDRQSIDTAEKLFNTSTFNLEELIEKREKVYDVTNFSNDPLYYATVDDYSAEIRNAFDKSKDFAYKAFKKFDTIADEVSSNYKLFKNTEKLNLTAGDIKDIMSNYYAIESLEGADEANRFLADYMQNRLAYNQTLGDQFWEGFKGIGASAYGSLVSLYGALDAVASKETYKKDNHNDDLSWWGNVWNEIIDNKYTRYGQDIVKYQTYSHDEINKMKASGYSGATIHKTVEAERGSLGEMIWDRTFLPTMMQQHGFTVASSGISFGSAAVANMVGKVLKAPTALIKMFGKSDDILESINNYKKFIDRTSKWWGGFLGAGFAGTGESITNSLETKDAFLEEGNKKIQDHLNEYLNSVSPILDEYMAGVENELLQESYARMNTENPMTQEEFDFAINTLYNAKRNELLGEYAPLLNKQLELLEKEATQAQNTNFAFNQAITGFLNATLKSTLMHPSVRRVFGKHLIDDSAYKVLEDGRWIKKAGFYAKKALGEMFGEGVEEWGTELTDGLSKGWHGADFEHYLENGYNILGEDAVDANFWAALAGAGMEGWKSATSKEAAYSFISGAFSSCISTMNVTGIADTYNTIKDPNASKADVAKSMLSILARSSVYEGIQTAKSELSEAAALMKSLKEFAANPENTARHTDAVRLATFMAERNASTDSELDYRNSQLGQAVSEINTLERLKDTNPIYYEKVMSELDSMENAEADSDYGKSLIEEYRHAGIADVTVSDADIINTIRKNATEFKKLREKVLKRRQANERQYGDSIDSDVLDALTYGDIAYEESKGRVSTMDSEIKESYEAGKDGTTTVHENTNASKKQVNHYINHGNKSVSQKTEKDLESSLKTDKAVLKDKEKAYKRAKRKDKAVIGREIELLKNKIQKNQEKLKTLQSSIKSSDINNTNDDIILSEDDIMNLSIADRAKVMSQDFYNKASEEQKQVIDNLKTILKNGDSVLSSRENNPIIGDSAIKIADSAKLQHSQKLHHDIRSKSGKDLSKYGRTIKLNVLKRQSETRMKHLAKVTDFNEFESILTELLKNPETSHMDRASAEEILKDNANYKRFKSKKENTSILLNKLGTLITSDKSLTKAEAVAELLMVRYLADNEITIDDTASMERLLTPENLQSYYNNISEGKIDPSIKFSYELIHDFISTANKAATQVEHVKQINDPIETTITPESQDIPKTEPKVTIETPEPVDTDVIEGENSGINTKLVSDSSVDFYGEVVNYLTDKGVNIKDPKVINALAGSLLYTIDAKSEKAATIAKAVIVALVNNNFENVDDSEVLEILEENGVDTSSQEFKDSVSRISLTIQNSKTSIENGRMMVWNKDRTDDINSNILDKIKNSQDVKPTVSTAGKEIFIEVHNADTAIGGLESTHNVLNWLKKKHSDLSKKHILVTVAADAPKEMFTEDSVPLYLVVRDNEGTIKIGGLKYQVIGVIPSDYDGKDADLVKEMQSLAIKQNLTKFGFIKKEAANDSDSFSNEPVSFEGFRIKSDAPEHKGENKSIKGMKGLKDLIHRLVSGTAQTPVNSSVTTLSYVSPFTGETVTTTTKKQSEDGKTERTYIAYIEESTGKSDKGSDRGESQIEVFTDSLDKYTLTNGVRFIDMLTDSKYANLLTDIDESGYIVAKYFSVLQEQIKLLASKVSEVSIDKDEKGNPKLREEVLNELKDQVSVLSNILNRYLYSKKCKLSIDTSVDASGDLVVYLSFKLNNGSTVSSIALAKSYNDRGITRLSPYSDVANLSNIQQFVRKAILEGDTLRVAGNHPVFKLQVDYENIDLAKQGYAARERKDKGESIEGDNVLIAVLNTVEHLIESDMLVVSKDGLDRTGWGIKFNKGVNSIKEGGDKKQPAESKGINGDGVVHDKKIAVSPETNPNIRAELDKLAELKKEIDANPSDTRKAGRKRISSRNYQYEEAINPAVEAVGNMYDSVVRGLINGDIKTVKDILSKYPNFDKDEAENIFEYINFLVEAAANKGWTLYTKEVMLLTTLPDKDGKDEAVSGTPDIIGYNANGELIVIDIKTFSPYTSKSDQNKMESWSGQTSDYANALSKILGRNVREVWAFPIEADYNIDATVSEGVLKEGIGDAKVTSKVRTFGDGLLVQLDYRKLPTQSPQPTQAGGEGGLDSTITGIMGTMGESSGDIDGLFNLLRTQEEEEIQSINCNLPG